MDDIDEKLKSKIVRITDLNKQFNSKEITFPIWQRDENWPIKYKQDLICSILNRRMIPMLFFAVLGDTTYILDGGHRTRAINSFMDNKYSVILQRGYNLINVFYNKNNCNNLTEDEKKYFDNYPLPIYKYNNITEDESRDIFNDLQHFRSMSNAEICNSYASHLVEYLRNLNNLNVNNLTIYEILELKNNSFQHPKCHNYLLVLIQLFSYYDGDSSISSLNDCNGGISCVTYIKGFKQDELEDEYKEIFESKLQLYFKFLYKIPKKNNLKRTTLYSIFHYLVWHKINNYDTFFTNLYELLLNNLMEYDDVKKNIESLRKNGKEDEAEIIRGSLKKYDKRITEWYDSTVGRGNTYSNGKSIRYTILKELFNYDEIKKELDEEIENMEQLIKIE